MKINRNNYEAFFLDYLEQRLTEEQKHELMEFLKQHPDLQSELNDFQMIYVSPPPIQYPHKDKLKMTAETTLPPLRQDTVEQWIIAYYEGDLHSEQTQALKEFLLHNPEYDELFHIYKKFRLKADRQIQYEHKSLLKHKPKSISLQYLVIPLSIAATLAGFWFLLTRNNTMIHQPIHVVQKGQATMHISKLKHLVHLQNIRNLDVNPITITNHQNCSGNIVHSTVHSEKQNISSKTLNTVSSDSLTFVPIASIAMHNDNSVPQIYDKKELHLSIVSFEPDQQSGHEQKKRIELTILFNQTEKIIARLDKLFEKNTGTAQMLETGIKIINVLFDDLITIHTDTTQTKPMFCLSSICINFP